MTVYVSSLPYAADRYHLFADSEDEALMAVYGAGSGIEALRIDRSPLHYDLTWQQVTRARELGARPVDKYAAYEAAARYHGNTGALASARGWRELDQAHLPLTLRRPVA